jgi:UDP-N-acetylmuramyl pentapeptide synthase
MKSLFRRLVVSILTAEARMVLSRHRPIVIAVTGSVGKTSTKDAIYTVLKNYRSTRKSDKSFNSDIGIPLTILGLPNAWNSPVGWLKNLIDGALVALFARRYPAVLVIEAGVDRPGDMARLTAWLRPQVVVITRLPDVPVHVEYFASPEAVATEKLTLAESLPEGGILIYNHDDVRLQEYIKTIRHQALGFGRDIKTHVTASKDQTYYHDDRPAGFKATISYLTESAEVRIAGVIGSQHCYTTAAAVAVGISQGLTVGESVSALSSDLLPPPGRMRVLPGIKGTTLIDDTYNSSPIAVEAALLSLSEIRYAKRKIAVLGDMLELGRFSAREHERVGDLVARSADVLVTVGIRSQKTAEAALAHGIPEKFVLQYEDALKAGRELQQLINVGDVILVKGSQGMRMERIVEELMAEPGRAREQLARQDAAWQER